MIQLTIHQTRRKSKSSTLLIHGLEVVKYKMFYIDGIFPANQIDYIFLDFQDQGATNRCFKLGYTPEKLTPGSLYYQPKQCTTLYRLIPQAW